MFYIPTGSTFACVYPTLTFSNCSGNFILTNGLDAGINAPEVVYNTASLIMVLEIIITGPYAYVNGF